MRESVLPVAGLNVELNREVPIADKLFIKSVYFLKKGVLKIDILDDKLFNPLYETKPNGGFGLTYSSTDPKNFTAYVLKFSLDLNLYPVAKKIVLTKDKFEFYVLDTISNAILESSSPEIYYEEIKPNALDKPTTSLDDYVKFKLSNLDTANDDYVQIIHKASGKCLRRKTISNVERLDLINCDMGAASSSPNTDFDSTLFKLIVPDTTPTGTPTLSNGQAFAILTSKNGMKLYTDNAGNTPAPKFISSDAKPYYNFRINYSRDITSFNNIPVFSLCAAFEITASDSNVKGAESLCLNVVSATVNAATFSYTTLSTSAKAAQLFSFRNVKLKPSETDQLKVEQKIDFQSDMVVIEWVITAAQSAKLYFSVQAANSDVTVSNLCNSRYPDRSAFPFVQSTNEYGIPVVRFRAPLLRLKSCGFVEVANKNPNLIGKIGYYTDPYSLASGKFSLVTFKLDSITSERMAKIDNPDSHNWYFRNTITALSLNIGSEVTFYNTNKFEKLLYTLPSAGTATVGSLRLKAFEKYTISKLAVYLINLDNQGADANIDTFSVPTSLVSSTPNLYNFTITLKNIISGKYQLIFKYVVKPASKSKRILAEDNIPLRKADINKSELEKYTSINVEIKGNEENSSMALRFLGFLAVLVMIAMN